MPGSGTLVFPLGVVVCVAGFAGVAGAGVVFVGAAFCFSRTLPLPAELRVAMIDKVSDVTMKSAAATVVARERTVADPRGPNAVCDPMPPKAPARSAALPLCSNTTTIRKKQTMTWIIVNITTMRFSSGRFDL